MSVNKDQKAGGEKQKGPFPNPAKNMTGDRASGDDDGHRDPSRAPGKQTIDRDSKKTLKPEGEDASGPEKDTAPQQSREAKRNQH